MDLKTVRETPPWDWPEGTGKRLGDMLRDRGAGGDARLLAVELAGDLTVIGERSSASFYPSSVAATSRRACGTGRRPPWARRSSTRIRGAVRGARRRAHQRVDLPRGPRDTA
jgi:hypothetical protein